MRTTRLYPFKERINLLIAGALAVSLYTRFHPILFCLTIFCIAAILIFAFIKILFGREKRHCALSFFVNLVASLAWIFALIADAKTSWLYRLELNINQHMYEECARSEHNVENKYTLAVCDKDDRWWRYDFTKAIIYDSSDQIELDEKNRSPAWLHAALNMDRQVPFGIVGFKAYRLIGHFYMVNFYNNLAQDLIHGD